MAVVLGLVLSAAGCDESPGAGDSGADADNAGGDAATDGSSDVEADGTEPDAEGDAEIDAGPPFSSTSVGLALTEVHFTDERLFDLDGDGTEDNAFAELGGDLSEGAVMLADTLLGASFDAGTSMGLYAARLDETGSSPLIALAGPGTVRDDELIAPRASLDGCGEPLFSFPTTVVDGRRLLASDGTFPLPLGQSLVSGAAVLSARLDGDGAALTADVQLAVAMTIAELGAAPGPASAGEGLTMLEALRAGGAPFGLPGTSGIAPDLDLDGDGLERVELGTDGHVAGCVDGDRTVISGSDCWQDPRIADAFSLTLRARATSAAFAGRAVGWRRECPGGIPETSLFGPEWPGSESPARQLALGDRHTCMLGADGSVCCWGEGAYGALGYGSTDNIGDDEPASAAGPVDVGERVTALSAGRRHTCAIVVGGGVRCWGSGEFGALGYGNTESIGDDEPPSAVGEVELGGEAVEIAAGDDFTCAILEGGRVSCWGAARDGQLGQPGSGNIGDDETPASAGDVDVGGTAVALAAGESHVCAILEGGSVRCWGTGVDGRLGYGSTENVGDDETPASVGNVDVGEPLLGLTAGVSHTCSLHEGGRVRCWGAGSGGQLGYGSLDAIGDDETPASAGVVDVGEPALGLDAGAQISAISHAGGRVRVWGTRMGGEVIGDDESPASAPPFELGEEILELAVGRSHLCAILATGDVLCAGGGSYGALGYGNTDTIGDDELPASAGAVPVACIP